MTTTAGRPNVRLWIGIAVLLVGILEIVETTGWFDAGRFLQWWPVLLVALGLYLLARGLPYGRWFPGALLALFGCALLAERLGWLEDGLDKLWPLVLVLLGLAIISRGLQRGAARDDRDRAEISRFAILAGLKPKITSTEFRGGDLTAILGSCELDLTEASTAEEGAVLEIFTLMGAVEIRVPQGWRVDSRVVPLMASVEDSTEGIGEASSGRLQLRGFVMMGGVEVKN